MSGSARGRVSLCGDVIGPVFPGDEPVSFESVFPSGNGRFGKGTEHHAFNLAANAWQLHYLRLTNQLTDNERYRDVAKAVFGQMNVEYTAVMRRFGSDGAFANWDGAPSSVWLTAWVVRIFSDVSFQDWEDFIYMDPKVCIFRFASNMKIMLFFPGYNLGCAMAAKLPDSRGSLHRDGGVRRFRGISLARRICG